jgi:hypothetical protein
MDVLPANIWKDGHASDCDCDFWIMERLASEIAQRITGLGGRLIGFWAACRRAFWTGRNKGCASTSNNLTTTLMIEMNRSFKMSSSVIPASV